MDGCGELVNPGGVPVLQI